MAALDDDLKTQLSGRTLRVISFALGSEEYGVDIAQVHEIKRMVTITRVPRAPQFMEGVINLRGRGGAALKAQRAGTSQAAEPMSVSEPSECRAKENRRSCRYTGYGL